MSETQRQITRSEYHADSTVETVRSEKDQIAWILKRRDCREYAISSKGLAAVVGLKATTVRDCIKEIRDERDLPIVSCPNGYYLIDGVDQLERELDRIQGEINTREETREELTKAFNRFMHSKSEHIDSGVEG